jgi:oligopeptidase A
MDPYNPLLDTRGIPKFDKILPEHIVPAVTQVLKESEIKLSAIESSLSPSWIGLIKPLEELSIPFEYAWSPIGHLLGVKNSEELREAHEKVLPQVVEFGLRMGQSRPIYDGLLAIKDGTEWHKLNSAQKRVVELKIRNAKLAGVGLSGDVKKRFNQISTELSQLGTDFSNHVLDATKAYEMIISEKDKTEGWPVNLKQQASQSYNQTNGDKVSKTEEGPWRISLEASIVIPFLKHSRIRIHREKLLKAYVSRANEGMLDNKPLIEQILRLRREKADLLGFETFADLSLEAKMAQSIDAVERMFTELFDASKPHQLDEFAEIEDIAQRNGFKEKIAQWDLAFWSERLKEEKFRFTDDEIRPYFPIGKVLEGMFGLAEYLFGIQIKNADGDAPVWHWDVKYFNVYESSERIASFYIDAFSRPSEKRGGAWMGNCLDKRIIDGKIRLPVIYLTANGTPPIGDKPSLLSFGEVRTLFHEFGHGLQAMLTRVTDPDVSGVNGIEWDAVETVSQFMANWCYHEPTLRKISGHYETGEPLPDELFQLLLDAKVYMAASGMMRQLELGMTDMALHSTYNPNGNVAPIEVYREIAKKTKVIEPMAENHFLCAFNHIFAGGYAAGYYSYKWAEVLSADLFSAFEAVGLENTEEVQNLGRKFRETLLAHGGSMEPIMVFIAFMGREPSTDALLKHNNLL